VLCVTDPTTLARCGHNFTTQKNQAHQEKSGEAVALMAALVKHELKQEERATAKSQGQGEL
jgi:hypothetical protein